MMTAVSQKRSERRRRQRARERWQASPDCQTLRRAIRRQRRRQQYPPVLWPFVYLVLCPHWGRTLGGRPRKARRCTKRLGTRYCWNWRVGGTTRCHRHQHEARLRNS
jgi:hypothetical protein